MSHHTIDLANVKQIISEIVSAHDIKSVAFVGCGASSSELYPGYYFLRDSAKQLRPFHYTASEFNQDTPAWVDETALVITCSLGGSTPETVEANHTAKTHGATVVAVTHVAGSALTEEADYSIVHGFELNYAAKIEKMGYVIALAVEVLNQTEGYENYDAIEVPYVDAIPSDYDGVMGVPRTFLDKYCPEQFEIIGCAEGESGRELGLKPYPRELKKLNPSLRDGQLYYIENGRPEKPYARILIRKK